jgi:hypothetical protein
VRCPLTRRRVDVALEQIEGLDEVAVAVDELMESPDTPDVRPIAQVAIKRAAFYAGGLSTSRSLGSYRGEEVSQRMLDWGSGKGGKS